MQDVEFARTLRRQVVEIVTRARASHVGSCMSCVEILTALYGPQGWLKVRPDEPEWVSRDRFIMSKGHAAAVLYATLAEVGFFPRGWLASYCTNGAKLGGHCTSRGVPGVELSTGSLGHGLPVGLGLALGLKASGQRVVVLLSDGELDEGSNWEAALMAPQQQLGNLVAIVDYNKIQSLGRVTEVIDLEPLADKWRAFGWAVHEVDGHSLPALRGALDVAGQGATPTVIIAHTVKGKGVSFMEDRLAWHYKSPSPEQYAAALAEIERGLDAESVQEVPT